MPDTFAPLAQMTFEGMTINAYESKLKPCFVGGLSKLTIDAVAVETL
ncbi:MAG: hypothetical protein ACR2M4_05640 [Actinomycetota bacterium]